MAGIGKVAACPLPGQGRWLSCASRLVAAPLKPLSKTSRCGTVFCRRSLQPNSCGTTTGILGALGGMRDSLSILPQHPELRCWLRLLGYNVLDERGRQYEDRAPGCRADKH